MNLLSTIKNNLKKAYNSNLLSTIGSLAIASTILFSSYAYFWQATIKALKPKKIHRKEDEKIIEMADEEDLNTINLENNKDKLLAVNLDYNETLEEESSEPVINVEIPKCNEDVLNDVGYKIYNNYLVNCAIKDNEKIEKSINDSVTIQLIKMGLINPEATNEEKIAWILKHYNLTMDEFRVVVAVVLAEAQNLSYEDAYCVINVIYNRTICKRWIDSVNRGQGEGLGTNPYNQVIHGTQFSVYYYGDKTYQLYLDATPEEYPGMQAVIDFLYGNFTYDFDNNEIIWHGPALMHHFTEFRGCGVQLDRDFVRFTSRGNKYIIPMKNYEYTSDDFTTISENEVEANAQEAESISREFNKLVNDGMNFDTAKKLVREKSN